MTNRVGVVATTMLVDAGLGLGGLGLASGPTLLHLSHRDGRHDPALTFAEQIDEPGEVHARWQA